MEKNQKHSHWNQAVHYLHFYFNIVLGDLATAEDKRSS